MFHIDCVIVFLIKISCLCVILNGDGVGVEPVGRCEASVYRVILSGANDPVNRLRSRTRRKEGDAEHRDLD